jgi:hypothetical protein
MRRPSKHEKSPEKRRSRGMLAPVAESAHPSPRRYGASLGIPTLTADHWPEINPQKTRLMATGELITTLA